MSDKYIMSERQADDVAAEIDRLRADNEKLREENERILAHKLALEWFPTLEKQVGCYDYRVATKEITRSFDVFRKRLLDPCYEENTRLREEAKIFREGFDGLTRGNQELQRQILSQYAVIDEMITTKGKLLKALQSIAVIEDEKKARAIAFEVLDDLYGVD